MTERAIAVPPSRALVFEVTALAPSTRVTTPSTPTSRIIIATRTSMRVNPSWAAERVREAIRTVLRHRACASRGVHPPMAVGAMADPLSVRNRCPLERRRAGPRARPLKKRLASVDYQVPALQPPPPPAGVQLLVTVEPL